MQALIDRLLDLIARVEAGIDFPEEDLPPEDRAALAAGLAELRAGVARLLATDRYGEVLRHGIRTVILGEPNAGKSSLLNRLLGRERALVSAEPGTTRDYLEEPVALGPHCIRLIDTAGLNPSPAPLERRGMEQTFARAAEADLVLLVLDGTRPQPDLPPEITSRLSPSAALAVVNKTDLAPFDGGLIPPCGLPVVRVSALTGAGIDELVEAITGRAESFRQDQGEDLVAINARHAGALREATVLLDAARVKLDKYSPIELLASDLRGALHALGEIAGRVDNERVLDRIFASFCIGK
jgi:tRNA modification GTPase